MNLTKEIIDETSILYREEPIYQVVDEKGKQLKKDQILWEEIMSDARYHTFMDKLDRWTRLLGTVLVKVSFVDPIDGTLVKKNEGGIVQLDMLHGGSYDMRHGASPYYISELLIGFGTKFGGFNGNSPNGGGIAGRVPSPSSYGSQDASAKNYRNTTPGHIASVDEIYWSPNAHTVVGKDGDNNPAKYETKNPYGLVPAVPFFNQDPAHYYFLPINEPLIYANHALNMRITDLNHIAKFQSFGVPVISGIERPTSLRQGRPVDDFNQLKGGTAQSSFGGLGGNTGFGAGGAFRTFDAGMGLVRDGNADAAALGVSIGPDTAIAVGEKGDFKFAHPSADIKGLIGAIESITDMVRINHGLKAKYNDTLPSSGYALMLEKMGVIEDNIRRGKLFKEREQQLFQVVKKLWNIHHGKRGSRKFSEKARLEITYKQPEFPVDPKTKMETLIIENKLLDSGDSRTYKQLYPHMSDADIKELIEQRRKDKKEQTEFETGLMIDSGKKMMKAGLDHGSLQDSKAKQKDEKVANAKIDNRAKHSSDSSNEKGNA